MIPYLFTRVPTWSVDPPFRGVKRASTSGAAGGTADLEGAGLFDVRLWCASPKTQVQGPPQAERYVT